MIDDIKLASDGDLNPQLYDFVVNADADAALDANYDDLLEQKLFKWKYRQFAMDELEYDERQERMVKRFFERAETRNPAIETDLYTVLDQSNTNNSIGQLVNDPSNFRDVVREETLPIREYMLDESVQ